MALSETQRAQINRLFTQYCRDDPRPEVRSQLRHGFRIDGNAVELYESRPAFQHPHDWRDHGVAKFRYVATKHMWQLYCQHRDLRWHRYERLPQAPSVDALLAEVEADPTGIFWG